MSFSMQSAAISHTRPKARTCSVCGARFNLAELSDYFLKSPRRAIKCFDCKSYNRLARPSVLKLITIGILFSPLFFLALCPSWIAILTLLEYLTGHAGMRTGRASGIVYLFPACIAVTYVVSRHIMRLIRFLFYPLEPYAK